MRKEAWMVFLLIGVLVISVSGVSADDNDSCNKTQENGELCEEDYECASGYCHTTEDDQKYCAEIVCAENPSLNLPVGICIGEIKKSSVDSNDYYCGKDKKWNLKKLNLKKSNEESCKDTDGGINYFTQGTVTFEGESYQDYCKEDNQTLVEYYCDNQNIMRNMTEVAPPGWGCGSGKFVPKTITAPGCEPDNGQGLPGGIPIKTQFQSTKTNRIFYCDLDSTWKAAKDDRASCLANYECKSNTCVDNECYSVKKELEMQTNLIVKIYCVVTNLYSYLDKKDQKEYLSCLDKYRRKGIIDEDGKTNECRGTPMNCSDEVLQIDLDGQLCLEVAGCEWDKNNKKCSGTPTPCSGIGLTECNKNHGCRLETIYHYD